MLRFRRLPLCGALLLFACASAGVGEAQTAREDALAEARVGRAVAARLAKRYGLLQDDGLVRYVTLVGRSAAAFSSRPELPFHFGILRSTEVNAFACPGGYILVTAGALLLMEDEAELAGVLSHEIAHVSLQHSGKFRGPTGWLDFITAVLSGPAGNVLNAAVKNASDEIEKVLIQKGRQKEFELEADRAGLVLAATAGYDARAVERYLRKVDSARGNGVLLATHPAIAERIRAISEFHAGQLADGGATNPGRFQEFKKRLSAVRIPSVPKAATAEPRP